MIFLIKSCNLFPGFVNKQEYWDQNRSSTRTEWSDAVQVRVEPTVVATYNVLGPSKCDLSQKYRRLFQNC